MNKRKIIIISTIFITIFTIIFIYSYNFVYSRALIQAILDDDVNKAKEILKYPGNIDSKPLLISIDSVNDQPIIEAAEQGNYEMVKLLIENNACVNVRGTNNTTALHRALSGRIEEKSSKYEVARLLVENGADVNAKVADMIVLETCLYGTVKTNEEELLKYEFFTYLLDKGANVYSDTRYYDNILYTAAVTGNTMVCDLLIKEYSFDVNYKTEKISYTVLMSAAQNYYDNTETVIYLLSNGADPNIVNAHNQTAYDIALEQGNHKIANIIKSYM